MKISVVICSRKTELSAELRDNIATTIGCEYELVVIDNSRNEYNIFQAYNKGVACSDGDILCFMHDDVRYLSKGWGNIVEDTFLDPEIGACAVAGCKVLRKAPSLFGIEKYNAINLQMKNGVWLGTSSDPAELATFDGVWFCIRRTCFDKIRFDDTTFHGFHFYDVDTAIQLHRAGYRIVFVPNMPIRHNDNSVTDVCWLENSFLCYQKNKDYLPIFTTEEKPDIHEMERLEMDVIYTSLRLIFRYRRWHLLGQWWRMSSEVLGKRKPRAAIKVLKNHFSREKR